MADDFQSSGQWPSYALSSWLFLKALAVVYGIAFASLGTQILGLIGSQGILPARHFLRSTKEVWGFTRFYCFPTLCWISHRDSFLLGLCFAGLTLSLMLLGGVAPVLVLALLWMIYLSLATVCRVFLSYQWDVLLLETGFLAIFAAPLTWFPTWPHVTEPSAIVRWLIYWLLFRLMFFSGYVKLRSRDATWRNLTTLQFHYETQPLPTPWAWQIHQCSAWFQKASVLVMFLIELLVPFLIFGPSSCRQAAGLSIIFLMLLIMATGNYCFFNLLTMALCIPLFDDAAWLSLIGRTGLEIAVPTGDPSGQWPAWILWPAMLALALLSFQRALSQLNPNFLWPAAIDKLSDWLSPFRVVNRYGLFSVMTTTRPEIIVEGSSDGQIWKPYEFKWKAGGLFRPPGFVQPHQPRLDWQMWFAALGHHSANRWFTAFLLRLLEGNPATLKLIHTNPFPNAPPRFIRAVLYRYQFTSREERRQTKAWWKRERIGPYCQELSLENAGKDL